MFNVKKQIGFLVLFFLMACGDSNPRTTGAIPGSPYGVQATGISAGNASLSSSSDSNLSQMQMRIFGTGGRVVKTYNGSARFVGTLTFKPDQIFTPTNQPIVPQTYPQQTYPHTPGVHPGGTQSLHYCGQRLIPFNCQGRIQNSSFTCQAVIYGHNYHIKGMLGDKVKIDQDYDIQFPQIYGPCTCPQNPFAGPRVALPGLGTGCQLQ